jgi:hypothetical protein
VSALCQSKHAQRTKFLAVECVASLPPPKTRRLYSSHRVTCLVHGHRAIQLFKVSFCLGSTALTPIHVQSPNLSGCEKVRTATSLKWAARANFAALNSFGIVLFPSNKFACAGLRVGVVDCESCLNFRPLRHRTGCV